MRALDPRLVRRTKSTQPLLALDSALGVGTALAVLAQATLLGRIVARGFDGARVSSLKLDFALLMTACAIRAALAWGMEVAGRRAAWSVLSEFRMALVEKRLRTQPIAADGTGAGELAAVAVQGIEGLEAYFARYLPQVVLASVVPLLIVIWVGLVDLASGLIMLLTLPLVPVFMWLIGTYAEERTRERWDALRDLSIRFLDVVRGLPTLRPSDNPAVKENASRRSASDIARPRWRRCVSASCPDRCWSWPRHSAWHWSPSTPGCAWSEAVSGCRLD